MHISRGIKTASPSSDQLNDCNCTALRKASRRLSQLYDSALAPTGLKSTQYSVLSEISRWTETPPTVRQLADALVMDRSTLGHNLRPLERDQLVSMAGVETDRRRRHVVLTQKGVATFAEAKKLWRTAQNHFEKTFGATQSAELRGILLGIAADGAFAQPMSASASTR
jgi:DNA-binding MarR family transcriptional regulator